MEVLLDNIRSVLNVGSMFRTADGAGIQHVHLCGITPTPDNRKLAKTALGAEDHVPWTHHNDGTAAAALLKDLGFQLWALEGGPGAEFLFDVVTEPLEGPLVLVVGNEVSGIDPGILAHCHRILQIPMMGVKNSLNVAVAFGIAAYALQYGSQRGFRKTT
jgi:tRNA G18 (ribose-2'-O)-methylase SpoU